MAGRVSEHPRGASEPQPHIIFNHMRWVVVCPTAGVFDDGCDSLSPCLPYDSVSGFAESFVYSPEDSLCVGTVDCRHFAVLVQPPVDMHPTAGRVDSFLTAGYLCECLQPPVDLVRGGVPAE